MNLYHATAARNLPAILADGLSPGTYLGERNIADYYAETVLDEGEDAVILAVDISGVPDERVEPDRASLEEPLTFTLGMSEEEVTDLWGETDGSWAACLDLIGSVRVQDAIPAAALSVVENLYVPALTDSTDPSIL